MRLALGFCGHIAKTAFSSLSARKLEAGHLVEVKLRLTLCCSAVSRFVCVFLRAAPTRRASLNRLPWPLCRLPKHFFSVLTRADDLRRCHSGSRRHCVTFCAPLHLIFSASHVLSFSRSQRGGGGGVGGGGGHGCKAVCRGGRRRAKLVVNELVTMHSRLFGMQR